MRTTFSRTLAIHKTRIHSLPVSSKNRRVLPTFVATLRKRLLRTRMRSPLVHPIATYCNVTPSKATIVRATRTYKLACLSTRRHGPLITAACNMNRLITRTVRRKYQHFLVKLNKDNADSTKGNVLRNLASSLTPNNAVRSILGNPLSNYRLVLTDSMHGPLCKPRNTTRVFTPRGKTAPAVIRRLSQHTHRFTRRSTQHVNESTSFRPNTKTTNKLKCTFLRCLRTVARSNTSLLLSLYRFSALLARASLIVANRKRTSHRALVNGLPRQMVQQTRTRRIPI